ncbi:hypothetical protein HN51_012634 [Arachis hypogaea]|uniref:uncharacterized protein n=1 Tax=Arachis hypogaea TaxID=3818 RepID=UPI000DEC6C4F|nr:uncharacterized protein LOC112790919 isoform X1 [Arachis hypogaea]QHO58143.1 nudix hydrolase 9-like isoform [Arachis hypogaea]
MEPANEIRSQGCKSSTGFMEGFTEQSAAVIPFLSRRRRVPHRWSSRLVLLCSAVFFCSRRAKTSALLCLSFYPAHTLLYFDLIPCLIVIAFWLCRYGSRELRITSHSSTETSSGTFVGTNLSPPWERFLVPSEALIMQS